MTITLKQFEDFIASFHKEPGTYTLDEYYLIGDMHRNLSKSDKSWAALCKAVGWKGSPNSYRCFVRRYRFTAGIEREEPGRVEVEDKPRPSEDTSYEEQLRRIKMEKTKVHDINLEYHRHIREEARIEELRDSLVEAIKTLKPLPLVKQPYKVEGERETEAILTFADLHIGPDFINSYNSYSPEIAAKRVRYLVSEVIHYCKTYHVTKLHFLNMGDLISGNIHATLRIEQRLDVVDQIKTAAEIVAEALNYLQEAVPELTYRSVVDNHARMLPNKNEHIESENFNRLIDWFLEERLKNTNVKFVYDNLDLGLGRFELGNGKIIMFSHGHQERKNTVTQDFVGLTREIPDYILLAHYHNSAEKTFQGMKVIITGCIVGTDPYAYGKRLFSHPEQKLLIFDKENLIDITIDLNIK